MCHFQFLRKPSGVHLHPGDPFCAAVDGAGFQFYGSGGGGGGNLAPACGCALVGDARTAAVGRIEFPAGMVVGGAGHHFGIDGAALEHHIRPEAEVVVAVEDGIRQAA